MQTQEQKIVSSHKTSSEGIYDQKRLVVNATGRFAG